jgi:hypothetical protein
MDARKDEAETAERGRESNSEDDGGSDPSGHHRSDQPELDARRDEEKDHARRRSFEVSAMNSSETPSGKHWRWYAAGVMTRAMETATRAIETRCSI